MPLVAACWGQAKLAAARVVAGQSACRAIRDPLEIYGKEKVYGSIP
jgi:hypothetical protein